MSTALQGLGLGTDLWQRVGTGARPAPSPLWQRSFGAAFVPGTGSTVGCQPRVLIPVGFQRKPFRRVSGAASQP